MSMCSLTDFIDSSLGPEQMLVSTATVTGQGTSQVDISEGRLKGLLVAKSGDLRGHQRGPQPATTGDFLWPWTATMRTTKLIIMKPRQGCHCTWLFDRDHRHFLRILKDADFDVGRSLTSVRQQRQLCALTEPRDLRPVEIA